MRLFFHHSVSGSATTYLLGSDEGEEAILIDPGSFDTDLLTLIEKNEFLISAILITHSHENHIAGIGTVRKIYKPELYGNQRSVMGMEVHTLSGGEKIDICGIPIETISIQGHSSDSLVYRAGDLLFTGDSLLAGRIGNTPSPYARDLLVSMIKSRLLVLPEQSVILPGHGPPSTILAEKRYNPILSVFHQQPPPEGTI